MLKYVVLECKHHFTDTECKNTISLGKTKLLRFCLMACNICFRLLSGPSKAKVCSNNTIVIGLLSYLGTDGLPIHLLNSDSWLQPMI